MSKNLKRRDFVKISAITAGGLALPGLGFAQFASNEEKPLRIGFVGIGGRGSCHLDAALGIKGVVVTAICDINVTNLHRAKRWVEEAGQSTPTLYGKTDIDYERMCEQEDLDVVICATSWKWHAPICIVAMKNDKHVVTEIPIILTIDEAWEVIETSEKTGKWATLALEQTLVESGYAMAVLNMMQKGVIGDVIHCEGDYSMTLEWLSLAQQKNSGDYNIPSTGTATFTRGIQ